MVEEFLGFYVIQPGMKINDPTWQTFISEIVSRFGGARNHYFLLDFLKNVSNSYLTEARQAVFVIDLFQLKVPKLFAMEEGSDEIAEKEDLEVARKFSFFLRGFINRHALKQSILVQMSTLLVCTCMYVLCVMIKLECINMYMYMHHIQVHVEHCCMRSNAIRLKQLCRVIQTWPDTITMYMYMCTMHDHVHVCDILL